jgi:hypothetical protein
VKDGDDKMLKAIGSIHVNYTTERLRVKHYNWNLIWKKLHMDSGFCPVFTHFLGLLC